MNPHGLINLRSDTVTVPTDEMYAAMREAPLGDVRNEFDPTVRRLEELASERLGKDSAIYLPSGTMCDTIAIKLQTQMGDEVITPQGSAVYIAGMLAYCGVTPRLVEHHKGHVTPQQVRANLSLFSEEGYRTGLVTLESTFNFAGGVAVPPEEIAAVAQVAHANRVPVHLDGARLFNAAVALGVRPSELAAPVDTLMFCLSKGLSCPIGSILLGPSDLIRKAAHHRDLMGGGWRQAGVLAAAGIVALTTMVDRLAEDHRNARALAKGLAGISGLAVDFDTVQTNMVYVTLTSPDVTASELVKEFEEHGVRTGAFGESRIRFVTHRLISRADIDRALEIIDQVMQRNQAVVA
jgi:threonine aldolase